MKDEQRRFLKYDLPNALRGLRILLRDGKVITADERINKLGLEYYKLFPFRYGSSMIDKNDKEELKRMLEESK